MNSKVIRLCIMMFLQFFLWGAWYVTAPSFLVPNSGFEGGDVGWLYSVGPIAGMLAPFFVGMIADRFFATERVLGVMHILGGVFMIMATQLMQTGKPSPGMINLVFFFHMLCYYPTLALTNTLAMHNMTNPEKEFPVVRVFGTIGWIVAGVVLATLGWGASVNMFYMAAGAGIVLGLFSFFLPHTPPPAAGKSTSLTDILGVDALSYLLGNRSYVVFLVCSTLICIPLAFYYQLAARTVEQAGITDVPWKMTWGQISEIGFMLAIPFMFSRLGVKWMLVVGMATWVLRYALFAVAAPFPDVVNYQVLILIGVAVHGICYDFFFVTGQIYTDKAAPEHIRGQAQGLLVLFTLGIGMAIGAQVAGRIEAQSTPPDSATGFAKVNLVQMVGRLTLREDPQVNEKADEAARDAKLDEAVALYDNGAVPYSDVIVQLGWTKAADAPKDSPDPTGEINMTALRGMDWRNIWSLPAYFAFGVMVIFVVLFQDSGKSGDNKEKDSADDAPKEEGAFEDR